MRVSLSKCSSFEGYTKYLLVPRILEIYTNVKSIPGFKFGFSFCNIDEVFESVRSGNCSKIKIHYFITKDIDQNKYFNSFKNIYREILIDEKNITFLFEKRIFNILKLQFLLNIKNTNTPEIYVNTFYHNYWKNTIGNIYPPGNILHNVIGIILTLNDFVPICFSAAKIYDKSFLLIGISGSGKTSLLIKIIKNGGKVISEDNLVIDKSGNIYPCIYLPTTTKSLKTIFAYYAESKVKTSYRNSLTLFNIFGEKNISLGGKIDGVIFLEKGEPCIRELSLDEGLSRILILNKGNYFYETIPITQALMFFNEKLRKVREKEKEILIKTLVKSKIALIRWKTVSDLYNNFVKLAKKV